MSAAPREGRAIPEGRSAWLPPPTLPLAYFAGAHLAFAIACGILVWSPELPGAFHYHPRAIALVHLVTLGWITASILGALYIVGPLALGVPMRAGVPDAAVCGLFWAGTFGIATSFWTGRYDWAGRWSGIVLATVLFVGARMARGLWSARVPSGVALHVVLAFVNVLAAGGLGLIVATTRATGGLPWSPMAVALAHGHLAVLGWAVMMIFGVAYRLIPMFVPAAMPVGPSLAVSAILLEAGTLGLAVSLLRESSLLPWVGLVIAAFVSFFLRIRGIVRERRPRPAELPRRDWSTWQAHVSLLYLLAAGALGLYVAAAGASPALAWVYGVAGLVGFVSQMIVGIQGRLLPMQAWYRAMSVRQGVPPPRSAHRLIEPLPAVAILVLWLAGVPLLAGGLALVRPPGVALGAAALLSATAVNAAYVARMIRRVRRGDG